MSTLHLDRETSHRWNRSVVVWLDPSTARWGRDTGGAIATTVPRTGDRDNVGGMAVALRQDGGTCRHDETEAFRSNDTNLIENRETFLQEKSILRQFGTTQHLDISHADIGPGGCAPADSANQIASCAISGREVEQSNIVALYDSGSFRHLLQPAVHAANEGASCVCDTDHPSGIIPLPGILTSKNFSRTANDIGKYSVCGEGRTS